MGTPKISQLKLSSSLGANRGDFHCGPMTFFAFFQHFKSELKFEEQKTLRDYKRFVQTYYPSFNKSTYFTLEVGVEGIQKRHENLLRDRKILELERTIHTRSLVRSTHKRFKSALDDKGPFVLQIVAYHAEVKQKKNVWTRGLGHFVLVLNISNIRSPEDPFFELEYWDPWDGKNHRAIAYEELYRDFTGPSVTPVSAGSRKLMPISPAGHRVQSPYLCLLAPHMDLYSANVYFAQRYIYVLERAFA